METQVASEYNGKHAEVQPEAPAPAMANDRRSPFQTLRWYISIGGMFGNLVFLLIGATVGFYYGGLGGTRFFEELFLIKRAGSVAAIAGSVVGVLMGLICVWAIMVIMFACCGAMLFWIRYRHIPMPPPS
jgi:hypothetical protein